MDELLNARRIPLRLEVITLRRQANIARRALHDLIDVAKGRRTP